MERSKAQPNTTVKGEDQSAPHASPTPGGSAQHDYYGGLDQHETEVDRDAASEVGADQLGPAGLNLKSDTPTDAQRKAQE